MRGFLNNAWTGFKISIPPMALSCAYMAYQYRAGVAAIPTWALVKTLSFNLTSTMQCDLASIWLGCTSIAATMSIRALRDKRVDAFIRKNSYISNLTYFVLYEAAAISTCAYSMFVLGYTASAATSIALGMISIVQLVELARYRWAKSVVEKRDLRGENFGREASSEEVITDSQIQEYQQGIQEFKNDLEEHGINTAELPEDDCTGITKLSEIELSQDTVNDALDKISKGLRIDFSVYKENIDIVMGILEKIQDASATNNAMGLDDDTQKSFAENLRIFLDAMEIIEKAPKAQVQTAKKEKPTPPPTTYTERAGIFVPNYGMVL